MNRLFTTLLAFYIRLTSSCLPTQTVEVTTTTTTAEPYPCTGCPELYGTDCLGPFCATAAEVGIKYTVGILTGYNYGDSDTCSTIFNCPLGTTSKVKELLTGWIVDGPTLVIATCQQTTGSNPGVWYLGIPPLVTPIEIVQTSCESVIPYVPSG